jgi:hypothetical protein
VSGIYFNIDDKLIKINDEVFFFEKLKEIKEKKDVENNNLFVIKSLLFVELEEDDYVLVKCFKCGVLFPVNKQRLEMETMHYCQTCVYIEANESFRLRNLNTSYYHK